MAKPNYMHTGDTPPKKVPLGVKPVWYADTWKTLQGIQTVGELKEMVRNQPRVVQRNWSRALRYFSEDPRADWSYRIYLGYRGRLHDSQIVPERALMAIVLWFEKNRKVTSANLRVLNAFSSLVIARFTEWSTPEVNDNGDAIGYGYFPRNPPPSRMHHK